MNITDWKKETGWDLFYKNDTRPVLDLFYKKYGGRMNGWMGVKAVLRITYRNKQQFKFFRKSSTNFNLIELWTTSPSFLKKLSNNCINFTKSISKCSTFLLSYFWPTKNQQWKTFDPFQKWQWSTKVKTIQSNWQTTCLTVKITFAVVVFYCKFSKIIIPTRINSGEQLMLKIKKVEDLLLRPVLFCWILPFIQPLFR